MPSWTLIKELGASFCFICCQCLASYCDMFFLLLLFFLSNHQFAVIMEWGERLGCLWKSSNGCCCPRVKELLAAPAAANQHLQKPTAREAVRVGGIQETSELICMVLCNSQQKPNVLKGESAKLLSRLSTAGKWKRHLQICVSRPGNKYSVERRNLS